MIKLMLDFGLLLLVVMLGGWLGFYAFSKWDRDALLDWFGGSGHVIQDCG